MFAGAAREAVFSKAEVIRRVQKEFVPVALKAGLINNPPNGAEGRLYAEIGRSKPAPQGICVVNAAGKVLDWALMFDDDQSVLTFLSHCVKRFAKYPAAKEPVSAERFMRFPSEKLDDVADTGTPLPIPERHAAGTSCPGERPVVKGTMLARVFGRALHKDGKPMGDTLRQEHYVEDRFHIPAATQEALARALVKSDKRVPLPESLARLVASHAYLGQLDVNPVAAPGGRGGLTQCEFLGTRIGSSDKGIVTVRIEGKSEAVGGSHGDQPQAGDGRTWRHEVALTWEGLIEMKDQRIHRLLLVARGDEKLQWGNRVWKLRAEPDVVHLPGGHPIDLACGVRYGIIGEPVPEAQTAFDTADEPPVQIPDEARQQLVHALGPPFLVFRDQVQEELKLTESQKHKLQERLHETVQETMKFFEAQKDRQPEEQGKAHHAYRQKAHDKLFTFLKETLTDRQRERWKQIILQQEGLFALGTPEVLAELKLSDEQKKQFVQVVHDLETKLQPLMKQVQAGGNPEEFRPKAMALRRAHERRLETILTDAQKGQWRTMLGKPFKLDE